MENESICVRLTFEKWSPGFKNKSLGLDVKDYDWKEEAVYIYPDTYKTKLRLELRIKTEEHMPVHSSLIKNQNSKNCLD